MRSFADVTLSLLLLITEIAAHDIPLMRQTQRRRLSSARHTKRSIDNNLLFSDAAIIAPISIGTPSQTLCVLLDTSSSDMALFSPAYISQYTAPSSSSSSSLGTAYNSSSSSSYQSTTTSFQNNYGNGPTASSFVANLGKDTIAIEGLELINQPIGVIQSGNVSYGPMASGILGLAFQAVSTGMLATPPIHQLYLDGALKAPLFSFALRRPSAASELSSQSTITQPGGIFTLGKLDNDQYQGQIGWSTLVSSGTKPSVPTKWLAPLDNITVNGILVDGSQGLVANFDTGSSASRASASTLASIFVNAKGAVMSSDGDYYLPCGAGTVPAMNVTISMGGVSVSIEPLDLLYKTQAYTNGEDVYCESTLTTTTSQQYDLQIGDDMMRSLFVAFQYDPPQVGIAEQSTAIYNKGAAPSYAFTTNQAIAIDSPTTPSAPTTFSHVSVQTVASRGAAFQPVITEAGDVYTFEEGGQYVSTANVPEPTVTANSTPTPLGSVDSSSSRGSASTSDSGHSSSSPSHTAPLILLLISFIVSAGFLFF
jgi:cathepsin D